MNEPLWLTREDAEEMQRAAIDVAGGASGLRDAGLLDSALAVPRNLYAYGETDLFQLAAGYAEAIARNHAFVDGNKRTAFQAADVFLFLNGFSLDHAPALEHAEMMEQLAQGHITRNVAAAHLRQHAQEL